MCPRRRPSRGRARSPRRMQSQFTSHQDVPSSGKTGVRRAVGHERTADRCSQTRLDRFAGGVTNRPGVARPRSVRGLAHIGMAIVRAGGHRKPRVPASPASEDVHDARTPPRQVGALTALLGLDHGLQAMPNPKEPNTKPWSLAPEATGLGRPLDALDDVRRRAVRPGMFARHGGTGDGA